MGRVFVEIDLSQAESRAVAMDACEETLLGMLERKEDIHKFVASEIFQKPMADITTEERQLGKRSGHGANYGMGVSTFQDSCLKELDLVLDAKMAKRVLDSYHRVFPRIQKHHARIRDIVYRERKLSTPFGRVRYFYGRCDANTYREAYAYRPQSIVCDITNHLLLSLCDRRIEGSLNFWLHCQIHDSVVLSCERPEVDAIAQYATCTDKWHPEVILPAGRLVIPTEVKFGRNLGRMEKWKTK